MKLCLPVIIYLILIAASMAQKFLNPSSTRAVVNTLISQAAILAVLYFLCQGGYVTGAWLILLAPILFLAAIMLIGMVRGPDNAIMPMQHEKRDE